MTRWQLAVAGTAAVGATVVVAWVLLLPYTFGQPTTSPFLDSLRRRWAEGRAEAPQTQPLPLAEGRAEAARKPGQALALDPAGRFALLVPEVWVAAQSEAGMLAFALGSTTASFAYPASLTQAALASTTAATVDGHSAIRSEDGQRVQVVAQLPAGYAVLVAEGPEAAPFSAELLDGVYLNE